MHTTVPILWLVPEVCVSDAANDAAFRLCRCLPKWHASSAAEAPHGHDPGQYAGQHGHAPGPHVACHVRCWQHPTAPGADAAHEHIHLMLACFVHCTAAFAVPLKADLQAQNSLAITLKLAPTDSISQQTGAYVSQCPSVLCCVYLASSSCYGLCPTMLFA